MEPGKRQHLQDIYASDQSSKDDYTPQISKAIQDERKRDLRRHQLSSFFMGLTILVLAVALVYLVVSRYWSIQKAAEAPEAITSTDILGMSLTPEEEWVLDYDRNFLDPDLGWDGKGERPFNTYWLKKATGNIIKAEQAYQQRKFAEAAELFENALEILPDLKGVKVPLGMVYIELKNYEKALALFEDVSKTDLTFDVLSNLGAACIPAEAYARGEEYLTRALELKPNYAHALKNLAVLQSKQRKDKEAIAAYEAYLDQQPNDLDTRHNFALYLTKIGDWQIAGEQLRALTAQIKDDTTLYELLAQVEMKLGNDKAAITALQRAMQLSDPRFSAAKLDSKEFDQLRQNKDFQSLMKRLKNN